MLSKILPELAFQKIERLDFVFIDGDRSILSTISNFAVVVNYLRINGMCAIRFA